MSYIYSNGLCFEALRRLSSDDEFGSRLGRAFSEMGVSNYGDTSDKIWKEWKELQAKCHSIRCEIYKQRKESGPSDQTLMELKNCAESLVGIIYNWIEYNVGQISKGTLRKAS